MSELLDAHGRAWAARLAELVGELDVPGAAFGVSHANTRILAAAGTRGLRDPAPVTVDTAFQIGSISKLYTATLLLMLGGADVLGRRVAELVPEAAWMDGIEVRHLLLHASGLGGDWFRDTGRGEECLARYVAELREIPRDVPGPPGERYSYCNSGWVVLGRVVEVLGGGSYDALLRDRLLAPLGAEATSTLPEQAILGPVATGHNRPEGGALAADPEWNFARALGPAGGISASAGDVLSFAELHLGDGRTPGGQRLLPADLARLMRERDLEVAPLFQPSARGLGFGIFDWPGACAVGHDGETLGQIATLRLLPEHGLALVVLTNAIPDGDAIARALEEEVLGALGLAPPRLPAPREDPGFDPAPYLGTYANLTGTVELSAEPGGLRRTMRTGAEGLPEGVAVAHLRPIGDGAFVDAGTPAPRRAVRLGDLGADGRCRSFFNGRVWWRCPDGE